MKLSSILPWALCASAVIPQLTQSSQRVTLNPADQAKLDLLTVSSTSFGEPVLKVAAIVAADSLIAGGEVPVVVGDGNLLIKPEANQWFFAGGSIIANTNFDEITVNDSFLFNCETVGPNTDFGIHGCFGFNAGFDSEGQGANFQSSFIASSTHLSPFLSSYVPAYRVNSTDL